MTFVHSPAAVPRATELVIDEELSGQRIDNFLMTRLKGVPRSHVYRLLRTGQVRVNRGRIGPGHRLAAGERVRLPPVRQAEPRAGGGPVPARLRGLTVLHEDAVLLVIDKASGVAVHGGSGVSLGVIEALRRERPEAPFLELVHRLDRDTSGCLVIAKRRSALRALHEALREGRVTKRYLALLAGRLGGAAEREVHGALSRTERGGERIVRIDAEGKPSVTRFRRLAANARATLVEAEPLTGRTHQIRVHAASLGHPVAGDAKYGDAEFDKALAGLTGARRLYLHARSIAFDHPVSGERLCVYAPLDVAWYTALDALGLS